MIHQYINNGYPIVLDVNSGSVHVMDELSYQAVPLLEPVWKAWREQEKAGKSGNPGTYPEEERKEAEGIADALLEEAVKALRELSCPAEEKREIAEELFTLAQMEQLYTEDIYENYIFDFKNRQTVVKALCLHIAHDCNLACKYCFAEEGEYHGRRALMSFEVGKKALDFLVANSGKRINLEVDFFGGEPLLNWQVVKDLVAYGRSLEEPFHKKFRFTLTTNGVLLNDEILEFCNREMANIVLSIDGRKEIHDLMRPFRGGQGSYDMVVPKFKQAAESRFEQISVEPVVADEKSEAYAIREEDIPVILEEYDRLAKEILRYRKEGKGFNFFHFMIDLEGGPCVAKRLSGCGSGTEYLAVTPWGDFYPCHQFVGQEEFLMGNVDEGILRTDIRDSFKECNVYAKKECRDCFAKFYCSGGCAANSRHFHGNITSVYEVGCKMQRKRIECAIMLKAASADLN